MSSHSEKPVRVGVAVVIRRGNEILLIRRHGSHGSGTWSVPGGHLEFGESWEACAKREVLEEVGLDIAGTRFLTVTNDIMPGGDKHYISIWMECTLSESDEPHICEPYKITELHWARPSALPSPLFEPFWSNLRLVLPSFFAPED